MKRKCEKCGDEMYAIGISKGDEQGYDMIIICEHCYMLEQMKDDSIDYEQFSDADEGL